MEQGRLAQAGSRGDICICEAAPQHRSPPHRAC